MIDVFILDRISEILLVLFLNQNKSFTLVINIRNTYIKDLAADCDVKSTSNRRITLKAPNELDLSFFLLLLIMNSLLIINYRNCSGSILDFTT